MTEGLPLAPGGGQILRPKKTQRDCCAPEAGSPAIDPNFYSLAITIAMDKQFLRTPFQAHRELDSRDFFGFSANSLGSWTPTQGAKRDTVSETLARPRRMDDNLVLPSATVTALLSSSKSSS
jgi:hypothetical protein